MIDPKDRRPEPRARILATLGLAATAAYCVVRAAMTFRSGRPDTDGGALLFAEWLAFFSFIIIYPSVDPRAMDPRRLRDWLPFGLIMTASLCGLAAVSRRLLVTFLVVFANTFGGFLLRITDPAAHDELVLRWLACFIALGASIAAGAIAGLAGLSHGVEWLTGAVYFVLLGAAEWSGIYQRLLQRTPN